jgi:PmbA protein
LTRFAAEAPVAEIAASAIESARREGASACDAVIVELDSSASGVRMREIETVKLSRERRLGLRCLVGRGTAVASTADLDRAAIERLAADVVAMARLVEPDPLAGLPAPELLSRDHPDLQLVDLAGLEITPEERVERALRCEAAALDSDVRIVNSEGAGFSARGSRATYASSAGFSGSYATTSYSLWAAPVATLDGAMQGDSWYDSRRALARLASPEEVGRTAAQRALRRLGARPIPTQEVPVVFDPQTAATLFGHLASAACGGALYRRASFLLDRLGEVVASPLVTVVDDGRLVAGPASRPFDAEGVATRRTVVVEKGTLQSYLLDCYGAAKLGLASTGNAARAVGDVPTSAPTNLHLVPGTSSPAEIIASVPQGLYVTSLSGFGVNGVTGDYSRGAAGLWIERGELAWPVEEVTIAGNLLEMLRSIEMVGDDLSFRSSIAAPTLKIARMTVGGR